VSALRGAASPVVGSAAATVAAPAAAIQRRRVKDVGLDIRVRRV